MIMTKVEVFITNKNFLSFMKSKRKRIKNVIFGYKGSPGSLFLENTDE